MTKPKDDPHGLIKQAEMLGVGNAVRQLLGCDYGTTVWVGPAEDRDAAEAEPCDEQATKRIALHVSEQSVMWCKFCPRHAAIVEEWSTRREQSEGS